MTYRSSWLEAHDCIETDAAIKGQALTDPRKDHLFELATLAAWARRKELPIYYVDNCWVRVLVDAHQLRQFIHDTNVGPVAGIAEQRTYVLVAEEF